MCVPTGDALLGAIPHPVVVPVRQAEELLERAWCHAGGVGNGLDALAVEAAELAADVGVQVGGGAVVGEAGSEAAKQLGERAGASPSARTATSAIALPEELRQLDTSQRLRDRSRAALATPTLSTGRRLFQAACEGGARAAGRASGAIESGRWADLLALDGEHPDLAGLTGDTILDAFAFAGGREMVAELWSAGRHLVSGGRHVGREAIVEGYRAAVAPLRDGL